MSEDTQTTNNNEATESGDSLSEALNARVADPSQDSQLEVKNEWQAFHTEEGEIYYYNPFSGETSWTLPTPETSWTVETSWSLPASNTNGNEHEKPSSTQSENPPSNLETHQQMPAETIQNAENTSRHYELDEEVLTTVNPEMSEKMLAYEKLKKKKEIEGKLNLNQLEDDELLKQISDFEKKKQGKELTSKPTSSSFFKRSDISSNSLNIPLRQIRTSNFHQLIAMILLLIALFLLLVLSVDSSLESESRIRNSAINELIQTERDFIWYLEMIVQVLIPLFRTKLKPQQLQEIFSNIETILPVNIELFSRLEQQVHEKGVNAMISMPFIAMVKQSFTCIE